MTTSKKPSRGWLRCVVLVLCFCPALGLQARGHSAHAKRPPEARRWLDLDLLLKEELHANADALWGEYPALALQVMILRAGRELPATLSAARRAERQESRAEALDWLGEHIARDPTFGELWTVVTGALLADFDRATMWNATARTLGRLEQYDWAEEIARGLASERPEIAQAARAALFDLYLQWFEGRETFQSFHSKADGAGDGPFFRQRARDFEQSERELRIELLEHEPQRALVFFGGLDPRLRAAAAGALSSADLGEDGEAGALLLAQLTVEVDAAAFHAMVEALLELQSSAAADAPQLAALRATLARILAGGPADLQGPAAHALARVPWGEDGALLKDAAGVLAAQLERLTAPGVLTDRDVLVTSLQSLWTLGEGASDLGLDLQEPLAPVRAVVLGVLSAEEEFEGVRVAAARLLPVVGHLGDLALAISVLDAAGTSDELRFTLLADVGEMARGLEPTEPIAQKVLDTLLTRLSMDDADLRRRALAYLSDDDLAALASRADPARFVKSLAAETLPDLQAQLLALVSAHGNADHVAPLLALSNFDALASSGPAGMAQLVETLRGLAAGDAELILGTAARLLAVDDPLTRVARLREALVSVAGLDPTPARSLSPTQHAAIVTWARELRQSAGAVSGGQEFLRRLVEWHIPSCAHDALEDKPNLAHLQALFLSDSAGLDPEDGDAAAVLTHFASALEFALEHDSGVEYARILRDRGRFLLEEGQEAAALADLSAVFVSEQAWARETLGNEPAETVLGLSDLRRGAELLAGGDESAVLAPKRAREACVVSMALVRRAAWPREPTAVRVQDLRDLVQRATLARNPAYCDRAATFLAGLPALPPPPGDGDSATPALPSAPPGAAWTDLLADSAVHAELLTLAADLLSLGLELEHAPTPGEPEPEPEPPAELPSDTQGEPEEAPQKNIHPGQENLPSGVDLSPPESHSGPTKHRGVEQSGSSSGS